MFFPIVTQLNQTPADMLAIGVMLSPVLLAAAMSFARTLIVGGNR